MKAKIIKASIKRNFTLERTTIDPREIARRYDNSSDDLQSSDEIDDSETFSSSSEDGFSDGENRNETSEESESCINTDLDYEAIIDKVKERVINEIETIHREERNLLRKKFIDQTNQCLEDYYSILEDMKIYDFGIFPVDEFTSSLNCLDDILQNLRDNYEGENSNNLN